MELGLMFINKQDLLISSRITNFNVQISAVNIHSCSKMFGQNYNFDYVIFEFMLFFMIP